MTAGSILETYWEMDGMVTCQAEGSEKRMWSQRGKKDNADIKERCNRARRTSRSEKR